MPAPRRLTLIEQDNAQAGQSYTGLWVPTDGFTHVVGHWAATGDATVTAVIEESILDGLDHLGDPARDRLHVHSTQPLGPPGATGPEAPVVVRVRTPLVRLRLEVNGADAPTLRGCLMVA